MAKNRARKAPLPAGDTQQPKRNSNGQWLKGYSGAAGSDAARARRMLNLSTINELQFAFNKYGRAAIEKVARQQPAIFLKMLVLLVPRELEITQSSGTKGMSDEALEQAVQAIEGFLARRAAGPGADARVIEAQPEAEEPSASKP